MTTSPRIAIVTGAAGGIGYECARLLGQTVAGIALFDISGDAVDEAARRLVSQGISATAFRVDVTSEQDVRKSVARVVREVGSPLILLNAAGILRPTGFLEISEAEWESVVGVSLKGSFLCSQACIPSMVEARWGRIVNFSSTAGKSVSTLGGAHYTAAKAGVLGLTRAVAKEMAPFGICVNAVCPGLIETDMARSSSTAEALAAYARSFPARRLGQAWEVAALVNFLCSDDAAYVTGASVDINGGDLMV
jgi:NAD(P)-dependent dehydrogenase (short-subunit alcohol dehydrogenase family)